MKKTFARLLGVLAVVALLAAACGDDDDSTSAAEGTGQEATTGDGNGGGSESEAGDGSEDHADGEDDDGSGSGEEGEDHAHGEDGEGHSHSHDHGEGIEVPAGEPVPTVAIEVTADPKKGQNLQVNLANFEVSPENASTEPVDGQGHLHLYVNGERVMRFYNEWLHLELEPGENMIEVEVSANNHQAYTVDGEPIRAMAMFMVEEPEADGGHGHSHSELVEVEAATAPTVAVEVFEDPKSGWNIHAVVENFEITPENASLEHVEGEGHLHLLADGQRVTRLYGDWWHLKELTKGEHLLTVEVATNDHRLYAVDGEPIVAEAVVVVPADKAVAPPDGGDEGMDEADVVINVGFADGEVDVADDRIPVDRNSIVAILVTSDVDEHVHVHGYDIFADVAAGQEAMIMFEADVPGLFEVEFEDSFTFITELEVS